MKTPVKGSRPPRSFHSLASSFLPIRRRLLPLSHGLPHRAATGWLLLHSFGAATGWLLLLSSGSGAAVALTDEVIAEAVNAQGADGGADDPAKM